MEALGTKRLEGVIAFFWLVIEGALTGIFILDN